MIRATRIIALVVLASAIPLVTRAESTGNSLVIQDVAKRPDRLVEITGERAETLVAEYSIDGKSWHPATIYLGASIDQRRASNIADWNHSTKTGMIPAGSTPCVWNYFFDIPRPAGNVQFRLRTANDDAKTILQKNLDLSAAKDIIVIDAKNTEQMCGGKLPGPWDFAAAGLKGTDTKSTHCKIDDNVKKHPVALVLKPGLKGWYRVYLGMETYSTCRVWLSGINARFEVPNYYNKSSQKKENRLFRESKICETDMTGQDICISPGGARDWHDVSIRYIRMVPMSKEEIAAHCELRLVAREKGRPFAGYVEPVTPAAYEPESLTLTEHIRNEMKLNQLRGSTDVYVHVIRIGSKAWYHSDVAERFMGCEPNWPRWMREGDPLAVAV
ncbi:MAG: hypothetical protein JXM70_03800, partial [Pirellulales bacterium]|nr:hypothetical protein [Pirellulales bacterium]